MLVNHIVYSLDNIYPIKNHSEVSKQIAFASQADSFSSRYDFLKTAFPDGINNINFSQGHYPDCQLLSAINAISKNTNGAQVLRKMIEFKDDTYKITFQKYPNKPIYVKKSEIQLQQTKSSLTPKKLCRDRVYGDEGMKVFEIAYAKLMKAIYPKKFQNVPDSEILSVYLNPNYHYASGVALEDITGWKVNTLIANGGNIPEESKSFIEESENKPELIDQTKKQLDSLSKNLDINVITACTAGSKFQGQYLDKEKEFMTWHDYAVLKIDAEKQQLDIANPYKKNHRLTISYDEFLKYFNLISVAEVPDKKLSPPIEKALKLNKNGADDGT